MAKTGTNYTKREGDSLREEKRKKRRRGHSHDRPTLFIFASFCNESFKFFWARACLALLLCLKYHEVHASHGIVNGLRLVVCEAPTYAPLLLFFKLSIHRHLTSIKPLPTTTQPLFNNTPHYYSLGIRTKN